VLYECVTGRPPFLGDSLLSILNQIAAGDFSRPSRLRADVSLAMEHAILRALQPDPAQRFDHVRDLGRELLEVAGMRTQMLWGRTFGRIDLSEPPFDPRSTSPLVLTRLAASQTPVPAPKPRRVRHVALGVATLAAILIPNLWSLRSPSEPAPPAAALTRRAQTGEAALSPAWRARGASLTSAAALSPAVLTPARATDAETARPAPSTDTVRETVAAARAVGSPARLTKAAAPARGNRRARPAATLEPRAARASTAPEPRAKTRRTSTSDPFAGEELELLRPVPLREGPARDAAGRARRSRGLWTGHDTVYAGANESPILD
jgi:hypothetical protein